MEVGVKGQQAQASRNVDTPTRVTAPVRDSNVPAPATEPRGVVESIADALKQITMTGLDTFRDVAVEAVPAYFAFQQASLARGAPVNASPALQRDRQTAAEIADGAQKEGVSKSIASSVKRADNTLTIALIVGGVVLALVSLGRD
jgi:hypothetical protein